VLLLCGAGLTFMLKPRASISSMQMTKLSAAGK
jgi:hypothetical protein